MSPAYTNATTERTKRDRINRLRERLKILAYDEHQREVVAILKGVLDLLEDEL